MKTTLAPLHSFPSRVLLVPCLALALSLDLASAQQTPNYAPPAAYQQQPGYGSSQAQRPGVGQRVGGFVKRLFYGDGQTAYAQPQYRSSYQPGRSLDAPPSAYRKAPQPSPQAMNSMPPAPAPATKPATKPKSSTPTTPAPSKSSSSKYTPPRIKPEAPAPKSAPKPAPKKIEEQPPAPTPSPAPTPTSTPTPTSPAPYTPPSFTETPASLNNQPSNAPTTLTGLTSTLPGTDPDTDTTSAITPSKPSTPTPQTDTPPKQTPTSNSAAGQFLIGKKTATPGRVISPYPPHQELDVSGLSSGSLALDPTTDKVFQIP